VKRRDLLVAATGLGLTAGAIQDGAEEGSRRPCWTVWLHRALYSRRAMQPCLLVAQAERRCTRAYTHIPTVCTDSRTMCTIFRCWTISRRCPGCCNNRVIGRHWSARNMLSRTPRCPTMLGWLPKSPVFGTSLKWPTFLGNGYARKGVGPFSLPLAIAIRIATRSISAIRANGPRSSARPTLRQRYWCPPTCRIFPAYAKIWPSTMNRSLPDAIATHSAVQLFSQPRTLTRSPGG
jgi:hypothetical protein